MINCYVGLGSNLGDREQLLRQAVNLLAGLSDISILRISSIYETEPLGFTEQPNFLNAVVELKTGLDPEILLRACQDIEQQLNRVRDLKWGPRTIDLDILLYNDQRISSQVLTIPHPFLDQRLFVLIPLAEISPLLTWNGLTVQQRINLIRDQGGITYYKAWTKEA